MKNGESTGEAGALAVPLGWEVGSCWEDFLPKVASEPTLKDGGLSGLSFALSSVNSSWAKTAMLRPREGGFLRMVLYDDLEEGADSGLSQRTLTSEKLLNTSRLSPERHKRWFYTMIMWVLSFIWLMWYITLVDFLMLNQHCIRGINPTWSWYRIIFYVFLDSVC